MNPRPLDYKAYAQFIERHDLHNAMLVGDKAFTCQSAKKQFQSDRGLNFLYPVRRNCKAIEKLNLYTQDNVLKTYSGVTYRIAEDDDGTYYYSFRNADRAASEELAYLEQKRKSGKRSFRKNFRNFADNGEQSSTTVMWS